MDVTDVLRDRMQEPPGLQRMAAVSALVHATVVAIVILGPGILMPQRKASPQPVMTISLSSGSVGAASGGLTALPGRSVQAEATPEEKRVAPTRAAEKAPEMTVPVKGKAPARPTTSAPVKQAPEDAKGRRLTKGAEVVAGNSSAETSVRGQGFGLSTSAGVGIGYQLDVTNFCCPSYLELMSQRIRERWDPRAETPAQVVIAFTIRRDGLLTDITAERSSGYPLLDNAAQRAVVTTRQLIPLPAEFPNPTLRVHLTFQYTR